MESRFRIWPLMAVAMLAFMPGCSSGDRANSKPIETSASDETDCWPAPAENLHELGATLYSHCRECHSLDGTPRVGPSWKGLWEQVVSGDVEFADGTRLAELTGENHLFVGPEDYLMQSMLLPQQKLRPSFDAVMPTYQGELSMLEIMGLIDFIKNFEKFDAEGRPLAKTQP